VKDIIAYSFSQELVGLENKGGTFYQNALKVHSASKLEQKGSFWEIFLGIPKDVKIVTFAPLRAEKPLSTISGPVLGVVEIIQDLSDDYKNIFKFQGLVILTISIVMGILMLVLIFVVKKGESIIQKRAYERMRLKDQLARSKHLSSLGEMVAGVSHEIRNPLGIISSSAELLKKRMNKEDPLNSISDIIIEESGRLNNIITDFLNFARPKEPNFINCRIDEIIEKNTTFLNTQIKNKGYDIRTYVSGNIPQVMADSDMLYQAFLNILINAMQAMPDGGVIEITIKQADNSLWIFFEDQGNGIPEHAMEKIWDPFYTTKEKGTG
ncbi:MAG: two-component sensor histidine kinase, partial [Desulfobacteraceae bacterium]|nr:two-component sensor histidine kinase [Desulfobacteraceae bacterium]